LVIFLFWFRQDLPSFAKASAGQAGLFRIIFIFHHFPEESDETQSRLTAGKTNQCILIALAYFLLTNIMGI
jgi:hypothetical protein